MSQEKFHWKITWPRLKNFCHSFLQSDAGLLSLCMIGQMIVLLASGFVPGLLFLGEGDGPLQHYPMYLHHFNHLPLEYTTAIQGGALYLSAYGMPLLYFLYSWDGVSLENYFFLLHFIFLIALPFYGLKIMQLSFLPKIALAEKFMLILFFSSMPAMGIRLINSHSNLVYGSCFFFITTTFLLAARKHQISLTLLLFSTLILLQIFPYFTYQMVHHGIFYAWPLLLVLWGLQTKDALPQNLNIPSSKTKYLSKHRHLFARWPIILKLLKTIWMNHRIFILLTSGCFLLCFYFFYGMYAMLQSGDLSRSLHQNDVTFSFFDGHWRDWWTSLFFSSHLVTYQRKRQILNEINYPLGPLIILILGLFLLPAKMQRPKSLLHPKLLGLIIGLWWGGMILFCQDVNPISSWILKYIPFAASFRIPQRTCFIACYVMQIVGCFVLYRLWPNGDGQNSQLFRHQRVYYWLLFLLLIISAFWISSAYLELCLDLLTLLLVFLLGLKNFYPLTLLKKISPLFFRLTALTLLTALAWQGFNERTNHRYFLAAKLRQIQHTGDKVKSFLQTKKSNTYPLERVYFDLRQAQVFANLGEFTQLNGLDGYTLPLRRFAQLATDDQYMTYTSIRFNQPSDDVIYQNELYAINYHIDQDLTSPERWLAIHPTERHPSYWMPRGSINIAANFDFLKQSFKEAAKKQQIYQQLWMMAEDVPHYEKAQQTAANWPNLALATKQEQASQTVVEFDLAKTDLAKDQPTPLILALNYTSLLKAIFHQNDKVYRLPTFVANGSLLGVMLPPSTVLCPIGHLEIKAVHPWFKGGDWILLLGGILLLLAFYLWEKNYHMLKNKLVRNKVGPSLF